MNVTEKLRDALQALKAFKDVRRFGEPHIPEVALENLESVIAYLDSESENVTLHLRNRLEVVFTKEDLLKEPPRTDRISWVRWWRDKTGESLTACLTALAHRETVSSVRELAGHV